MRARRFDLSGDANEANKLALDLKKRKNDDTSRFGDDDGQKPSPSLELGYIVTWKLDYYDYYLRNLRGKKLKATQTGFPKKLSSSRLGTQ